ncbi:MAG: hypothetical protein K6G00_02735 [Treponema sp.]|nr:hypothetical protein [Treponema sp.]
MTRFQKIILKKNVLCTLAACFILTQTLFAAVTSIKSKSGFLAIDLPEGFYLTSSSKDGKSYQLQSSVLPVTAAIKVYDKGIYSSAKEALTDNLTRMNAEKEIDSFNWRNQDFAISSYSNYLGQMAAAGYAASVTLPEEDGLIVMLIWTEQTQQAACNDLMLSFIDGLCIDFGSFYEAGPITKYAYPDSDKYIPVTMNITEREIKSFIRESDREANEYLIEREYNVLKLYAGHPLWKDAWTRYYRMIFRDSFKRLNRIAFDIFNELNPSCTDDTDLAQKLLTWTQGMNYEREKTSSDFASLPSIILGGGSDCDSRSMLLSVLLTSMNMDSIMFISNEFSHAVAGFVSTHPGHSFKANNKDYLLGETTAKGITWGMIAQEQDDQSKWIPVLFY